MNAMALPLLLMVVLVLVELAFVRILRSQPVPWRDVILNLNSGHILMWLFRGVEIAVYAFVVKYASLHAIADMHWLVVWTLAFVVWDFGFYWMHRLHHKLPWLWSVHVVHHEGEHFNLSLGIRNAWLSSLTTLPFTSIPLALAGVPLDVFIGVSTFHYTVQFYNHNSLVGRSGWLDRVLVTPLHHRVHHGRNREYRDRNFGGTLLVWDKLFGSFQAVLPGVPVQYGVALPTPSTNPFWANVVPILRYAKLPVPQLKRGPSYSAISDVAIGVGGLLIFCEVAYYIHRDGTWPAVGQAVFFLLIFASTLVLGGMSDNRDWAVLAWVVLGSSGFAVMPMLIEVTDPVGLFLLAAMPLHGGAVAVLAYVARRANRRGSIRKG